MNIPQICSQLLKQGELVRIRCNQVRGDLSAIFALEENDLERFKDLKQLYYERLEQAAKDVADCEKAVEEAKETVKQLTSKAATRPIPFVRV